MNTTTVELPREIYIRLEHHAQANKLTIPQVILQLMEATERERGAAAIERLRTRGLLLIPQASTPSDSPPLKPIQVQGQPLSEAIIEERR